MDLTATSLTKESAIPSGNQTRLAGKWTVEIGGFPMKTSIQFGDFQLKTVDDTREYMWLYHSSESSTRYKSFFFDPQLRNNTQTFERNMSVVLVNMKGLKGWLVGSWAYPSEKYQFVNWDDDIPKSYGKIKVMFQSPPIRWGWFPLNKPCSMGKSTKNHHDREPPTSINILW